MSKKQKHKKTPAREILEWILTFVTALMIALPIRAFAFELVRVDGSSMDQTLADEEILFVSKYDYGSVWLALPWQDARTKERAARWSVGAEPERFDVVICRYPGRGDTNFVKRVVGLPGDTVELRDGYLYVNGERYEELYVANEYRIPGGSNGWFYRPYTVPDGEYFVMGDHRNNSNDSRAVGTITRDMIIGHARSVVWPVRSQRNIE